MAPNEIYRGSLGRITFTLRLLCFSLPILPWSQCTTSSAAVLNSTGVPVQPDQKILAIHKILRKINKPAVKTIQSPDGDIIDCVLIHQQRGFDPNVAIPEIPKSRGSSPTVEGDTTLKPLSQIWHLSGERCPNGTFPARRTTVEDLMRFDSPGLYGRKPRRRPLEIDRADNDADLHEYAVAGVSGRFHGSKGVFNLWNPKVATSDEFSVSQVWVLAGTYRDKDLNSIEAGWQVYKRLYGDTSTRLFTFWTSDAYRRTGCYNILCDGFVQIYNGAAIGGALYPLSSYDGKQYEIQIAVWKNATGDGKWWLELGGKMFGYWPDNIFTGLQNYSTNVEWGGEIVNMRSNDRHTTTEMGSGHFAAERYEKACYTRNLQVADMDGNYIDIDPPNLSKRNFNCYDIDFVRDPEWGVQIYFGGPGQNPNCP